MIYEVGVRNVKVMHNCLNSNKYRPMTLGTGHIEFLFEIYWSNIINDTMLTAIDAHFDK